MTSMTCHEFIDFLMEYLSGELAAAEGKYTQAAGREPLHVPVAALSHLRPELHRGGRLLC
jgi:hypothetical protein